MLHQAAHQQLCRGCRAGTCPAQLEGNSVSASPRSCSDQSLPLMSLWLPANSRCYVLQAGTATLAESSRMSAEPTPPPGEWSCTTTRCSSSFPFFSHFHLAPPDVPQVSACRSRMRRLTRFFQSPRQVVGPAAQAAPAPAGRPGRGSCSPRDGENNREYQICRRNAGDTVVGGPESLGSICSRLGRSPGDATQATLSPAARDARGMRRPPSGAGHQVAAGHRRTAPESPGNTALHGRLLMNHICGSRPGRQSCRCRTARGFHRRAGPTLGAASLVYVQHHTAAASPQTHTQQQPKPLPGAALDSKEGGRGPGR